MAKIKYRLKRNSTMNLSTENYIEKYLTELGINKKDIDSFIHQPKLEDQEYFGKLDNIDKAIEWLYKGFSEGKKFFLQVDSDVDGITSSAIFYSFFKELFPSAHIEYRLHEKKEHGVIVDTIPLNTDYVIIPDAGSVQLKEQKELAARGHKVIILDHHSADITEDIENVIIVNNQLSENFQNKDLSGAGVVYKTIQAFNIRYSDEFDFIYQQYADLAALGIISDMMNTKNLDNNYIIYKGLNNINNPMFKALLKKQSYSISSETNPTKIDIAFYIAPLMNGVIRFGDEFDKKELFRAFIDPEIDEIVETKYAGKIREEDFYDYIARTSYNIKEKQNREKMKCMEFLLDRIETQKLYEEQILIVKVSKDDEITIPKTITGLVAMELLKEYKKPTLVLRPRMRDGELYYAGSGRAKATSEFDSFRNFLNLSGFCEYAEGHDMAFGVSIHEENIDKLIEYANEKLADIEFETEEVEVDFIFNNENTNAELIFQFGEASHIYGNGIPQPKFAFEFILHEQEINYIGTRGMTIKFRVNEVDFLKFNNKKLVEELKSVETEFIKIIAIGRPQTNEWGGNITPQIIIDQVEVDKYEQDTKKLF